MFHFSSSSSSSLLVLLLSLLVVVIVTNSAASVVDGAYRPHAVDHQKHYYAPEQVHKDMPDHTDPKNKPALACSSCKVLTEEVWQRLHALAKRHGGKPRMHAQVDAIEKMCNEVKHEYGLVMRKNKPTLEFSRDETISRVRGGFINLYIEGRCGKILAQHEEQILEKYRQVRDLGEFQASICQRLDKSCLSEKFTKTPIPSATYNVDL